jgi:TatD DNase family protein
MSIQKDYFERQMILADRYKLPLIIHCVKAWDELLHLNQEHYAKNKRIVHGFRGKPELCRQLLDAGFYLSFGPRFNPLSLCLCPPDRRMMETDASGLSIQQVEELIRREC